MAKNSDFDFKSNDKIKLEQNIEDINKEVDQDKSKINEDKESLIDNSTSSENNETNEEVQKQDIIIEESDVLTLKELQEKINELEKEKKELNDKMYRIAADASNSSKQNQIDIDNAKKSTKKQVIKTLLPFLTTINLAFEFTPNNEESIKFSNQLKSAMDKINPDFEVLQVKFLIPLKDEPFNANTMQALNNSTDEEPKVKNVVSVGCIIDGQVIQPASVII
jgi:molecular chaperone GrpE